MYEFLHAAHGPVIPGLEEHEVVYAKDQPEYNPLRTLKPEADAIPLLEQWIDLLEHLRTIEARTNAVPVLSRWTLTPEQRQAVLDGADIYLELLTFGSPLQPIRMAVGKDLNPDFFREQYALPDATEKEKSNGL